MTGHTVPTVRNPVPVQQLRIGIRLTALDAEPRRFVVSPLRCTPVVSELRGDVAGESAPLAPDESVVDVA